MITTELNNNQVNVNKTVDRTSINSNQFNQTGQKQNLLGDQKEQSINIQSGVNPRKTADTNKYLVLVARLENGIKQNLIQLQEIKKTTQILADKIAKIDPKQFKYLTKLAEYKDIQPDSAKLSAVLTKQLQTSAEEQAKAFGLLKDKALISLLKGDFPVKLVYSKLNQPQRLSPAFAFGKASNYSVLHSGYSVKVS